MIFSRLHIKEVTSTTQEPCTPFNSLHLSSIQMQDFRNFERFELQEIGPLTIFTGPNAIGKTSVIEAIQMLTDLRSFRTSQYHQMVRWGCNLASISTIIEGDGRKLDLSLRLEDGKRSYFINGKARKIQEIKGLLPAVNFNPDDLNLVKGSNVNRRDAIDALGSQLSKNFYSVRSDYVRLLKQRNKALKDAASDEYINSIDDVFSRVGAQLITYRIHILKKLKPYFQAFYEEISSCDEKVDLIYIPSWINSEINKPCKSSFLEDNFDKNLMSESIKTSLLLSRNQEKAQGKTIIGPHADKVTFLLNQRDALHYSSQGQQRSIVLAFKLAEAQTVREVNNQNPILLLDDVLSELDKNRREFFLRFITDDMQTFITTTNAESLNQEISKNACFITLDSKKGE